MDPRGGPNIIFHVHKENGLGNRALAYAGRKGRDSDGPVCHLQALWVWPSSLTSLSLTLHH